MIERRRRILREARRMIGQGRFDELTIRELCRRAEVSSRTIYLAFGGKEAMVALAIRDYFEAFHRIMKFEAPEGSFEGAFERAIAATLRNVQQPNYIQAVAAIYFSPTIDPQIRGALLDIAQRPWISWLGGLRQSRQLEIGVDPDTVAVSLSDIQYAKVHQWAVDALDRSSFVKTTAQSMLLQLAGATRGGSRTKVRKWLSSLASEDEDWRNFIDAINTRLQAQWPDYPK